jgi:chromosome segregation ATPase
VATLRYEAGEMAAQRDAATSRAEAAEAEVVKLRGELVASMDERNRLAVALGRAEEAVAARDDALVTMRAERDEARMEVEKLRGQVQWLEGTAAQRHAEAAAAYALATERSERVEVLEAERDDALVAALRRIEAGVAKLGERTGEGVQPEQPEQSARGGD